MRFLLAIGAVLLSTVLSGASLPSPGTYEETLYPSHTCPGGHSWYVETSDADSVTVACYTPDDPEE